MMTSCFFLGFPDFSHLKKKGKKKTKQTKSHLQYFKRNETGNGNKIISSIVSSTHLQNFERDEIENRNKIYAQ